MAIYWSACYLSMILAYVTQKLAIGTSVLLTKRYCREALIFIAGFPLFVLSALRYNVGTDFSNYYLVFLQIKNGFIPELEPLYLFINELVAWLQLDFQWVVAICAALFVYFVFHEIYRTSKIIPFSIFLLVGSLQYFYSLTNIRQMTGCALLLFSLRYVEQKKFKKFVLCVIAASCFHTACAIYIVVYWIEKIKISLPKALLITGVAVVLRTPLSWVFRLAISYTKYENYLGSARWDAGDTSYATMVIQMAVLIFAVIYQNKKDKTYHLYLNIQYFSFWISLFSGILPQVYRIQRIFGMSAILLIPYALFNIKSQRQKLLIISAMIILYSLYAYTSAVLHDQFKIIPYRSIYT